MKKALLTAITISELFISIIAGVQVVGVAKANFILIPHIIIYEPENKTYPLSNVPLSFDWSSGFWSKEVWISYSIDGKELITIGKGTTSIDPHAPFDWHNSTLSGLSEGTHHLVIYAKDANGNIVPDMSHLLASNPEVYFTVTFTSPSPITSPTNSPTTSPTPSNSPTQQPTSTPTQSATPTIVPIADGVKNLPYIIGIIAVVIVAIIIVGLAVYFKQKQKRKK